jgi:hypothetical protein
LTIAIPVLLFYQFLLGRVDKLIDDIDEAGAEFVFSCADGDTALLAVEDEPEAKDEKSSAEEEG